MRLSICVLVAGAFIAQGCALKQTRRSDYNFRHTTLNYRADANHQKRLFTPKTKRKRPRKAPTRLTKNQRPIKPMRTVRRTKPSPFNGLRREPKTIKYPGKTPRRLAEVPIKPTITQPRVNQHRVPRGNPTTQRKKLIAVASTMLGKTVTALEFITTVLKANSVTLSTTGRGSAIQGLYYGLKKRRKVYDRDIPVAGDLVFFHNTADLNKDSRNNDWYSLIGVVETVASDGTISFIAPHFGTIKRLSMNLRRPQVRRDEKRGKVINAFLRIKRMDDPEYTQYLAGELYAGFGSVFGEGNKLVSRR